MLANIAIPSFLPHSFATLIGIFLIAAIEGWFVMRILNLKYTESYRHAFAANWMSTIAGIPLAWLLWVAGLIPVTWGLTAIGIDSNPAVQSTLMQTVMAGGMIPHEWMDIGSAAAWVIMLVPFCIGSVWIEQRTIRKRLPERDPLQISKAVVRGNLVSYSLFLILGLIVLWNALEEFPNQKARFKELRELKQEGTRFESK
ncbi:MAG: hypothetical protein V4710_15840 [Verrucomicrobiota bacterium]